MNILVINFGSTSLKYKLFAAKDFKELAEGGFNRVSRAKDEKMFKTNNSHY